METNQNTSNIKKPSNLKLLFPVLALIFIGVGYFVYQGFFAVEEGDLNETTNTYISKTKLGKNIEILNKEGFVFNSNMDNQLISDTVDFSVIINPSSVKGRSNPFLP